MVSAFSQPALRLSLFASVALGLDTCRLRANEIAMSRLFWDYAFETGVYVTTLSSGSLPPKVTKSAANKRKTAPNSAAGRAKNVRNAVVAAVMDQGTVMMFSLSEVAVVGVFDAERIGAVRFDTPGEEGHRWSCGDDGKSMI
jgi:hypothetical protein